MKTIDKTSEDFQNHFNWGYSLVKSWKYKHALKSIEDLAKQHPNNENLKSILKGASHALALQKEAERARLDELNLIEKGKERDKSLER